jgi:hypothetical protein
MHIMLVADTQVRNSYRDNTWLGPLRYIKHHSSIKKACKVAQTLRPDVVIFTGDMLASGGRVTSGKM